MASSSEVAVQHLGIITPTISSSTAAAGGSVAVGDSHHKSPLTGIGRSKSASPRTKEKHTLAIEGSRTGQEGDGEKMEVDETGDATQSEEENGEVGSLEGEEEMMPGMSPLSPSGAGKVPKAVVSDDEEEDDDEEEADEEDDNDDEQQVTSLLFSLVSTLFCFI
jgi:hypothetical protein